MKNIWTIFAMIFVFALTTSPAEAKKFGGGKTFGSTRQTAPAQPAPRQDAATPTQNPAAGAAAATAGKKGMLGGLMGGLLAGGLIAAMLGGAFEGIQFMDILIIGLLAFVLFKLLRRRPATAGPASQPAYNAPAPIPQADQRSAFDSVPPARDTLFGNGGGFSNGGFTASSVPFNLPPGFDMTAFLAGAREHYRTLQEAWNKNDLTQIQDYVTPSLYNDLKAERATLEGEQHTEVLFVDAEIVRADFDGKHAELSIKFSGRYRDTVEGVEELITDIWHLERDLTLANAPWYIAGIEG